MAIVIDASMTMAWCFEDEASSAADAVLDRVGTEGATVPSLWQLEVANVLVDDHGAAAEAIFAGKHVGEFAGVPATGNSSTYPLLGLKPPVLLVQKLLVSKQLESRKETTTWNTVA